MTFLRCPWRLAILVLLVLAPPLAAGARAQFRDDFDFSVKTDPEGASRLAVLYR